jgi:hypothetical protein
MLAHLGRPISLLPFEPITECPISLTVDVQYLGRGRVQFDFVLQDLSHHVIWPTAAPLPMQADFLWEHTCFEVFIQQDGQRSYTEFNFSPRRQWNAYHFDDYREPKQMPPLRERHIHLEGLEVSHHRVQAIVQLHPLYPAEALMRMNVCAVLAHPRGLLSYWALQHSGEMADFHRAKDRILTISLL